jgi:hypothetical protein
MGEQAIADLTKMIMALSVDMATMKADMATVKEKASSSSPVTGNIDDSHHNDRPPRFQKLDFPRFDGKSDPMIFINRSESYFHQQRTMPEEKVWMASFNLEDVAQLWYIQLQEDEGTPHWGGSRNFSICSLALLSDRLPCLSSRNAGAPGQWRSTSIGSKPSFLAQAAWTRPSWFSSTRVVSFHR